MDEKRKELNNNNYLIINKENYTKSNNSFDYYDSKKNEKDVLSKDGITNVNVKLNLDQNNNILVTVNNKLIDGKYGLYINKVDLKGNRISGVTFKAIKNNETILNCGPTSSNGEAKVFENEPRKGRHICKLEISCTGFG